MKKKFFWFSVKVILVLFLAGSLLYVYATELTPEDKKQFIEVDKPGEPGETISVKERAIEDPCTVGANAKEEAIKYVKQYKIKPESYPYKEAKTILSEIKAKKFDDMGHLATIIELSLYNWACKNEYKFHKTKKWVGYFYKKDAGQGIFVSMRTEGYYVKEGLTKGIAKLPLDMRGPMGERYCLYVVITKLNPKPNEKSGNELNESAKKILNEIVNFSYSWGLDYYTTIIEQVAKK